MQRATIERAAREVPRYTSYPPANHFHEGVGEAQYRDWLGAIAGRPEISLYLHLPFCRQLCWYCGCHTTIPNDYQRARDYVGLMRAESRMLAEAMAAHGGVGHLHFGGGTPTYLAADDLARLFEAIDGTFGFRAGAEIAVEVDPRGLDAAMARTLRALGVNRVSLGVQDFDPEVQREINRVQPFAQVADAVAALRAAGIDAINFDLMYGLPRQSVESVRRSAELAASLGPGRVAVFGYAHVPWFKKHQRMLDEASLPGTAARLAQAQAIAGALARQGYVAIGLDHFALPGDALAEAAETGTLRRNFQGYSTDRARVTLGLGASSIGSLPQGFVQNAPHLALYAERIREGRFPVQRGFALAPEDRLRAEVIERLMCDFAVDLPSLCRAHGFADDALDGAQAPLAELAADGLVHLDGGTISVPSEARHFVRMAAACFDSYLAPEGTRRHSRAV
ncbi:MAG: oxygen-independent coproporphyrinogen III oxidase [Alphaproteobacteria bacterium]|nr:oxygen-independent coproporphyrinogen III oxidase [Alphaproteobacteria bacterium]